MSRNRVLNDYDGGQMILYRSNQVWSRYVVVLIPCAPYDGEH